MSIKCDVCGKFISLRDLERGIATRKLLTPDSLFSTETYETLCKQHVGEGEAKAASLAGEKGSSNAD